MMYNGMLVTTEGFQTILTHLQTTSSSTHSSNGIMTEKDMIRKI